jgi:hypothetical protein
MNYLLEEDRSVIYLQANLLSSLKSFPIIYSYYLLFLKLALHKE